MQIIQDPAADGPANMQRDLDLLESLGDEPILRIYQWSSNWASYGYFQTEAEAAAYFPGAEIQFVKRPTGGGIVDHREDLTYTLLIPKNHPLARASRSESYRLIHESLAQALRAQQITALIAEQEQGEDPTCFTHPVPGDLIHPTTGQKIAGAAQRRSRKGILHQGSLLIPGISPELLAKDLRL